MVEFFHGQALSKPQPNMADTAGAPRIPNQLKEELWNRVSTMSKPPPEYSR